MLSHLLRDAQGAIEPSNPLRSAEFTTSSRKRGGVLVHGPARSGTVGPARGKPRRGRGSGASGPPAAHSILKPDLGLKRSIGRTRCSHDGSRDSLPQVRLRPDRHRVGSMPGVRTGVRPRGSVDLRDASARFTRSPRHRPRDRTRGGAYGLLRWSWDWPYGDSHHAAFRSIFGIGAALGVIAAVSAARNRSWFGRIPLLLTGTLCVWAGLFLASEKYFRVWQASPNSPDEAYADTAPLGALLAGWIPGGLFVGAVFAAGLFFLAWRRHRVCRSFRRSGPPSPPTTPTVPPTNPPPRST